MVMQDERLPAARQHVDVQGEIPGVVQQADGDPQIAGRDRVSTANRNIRPAVDTIANISPEGENLTSSVRLGSSVKSGGPTCGTGRSGAGGCVALLIRSNDRSRDASI
jgi:hypothetical protein